MRSRSLLLLLLLLLLPLPTAAADEAIVPRTMTLPAAGISARVHRLACGIAVLPGRGIYDWRCVDPSNRVLLAHAYAAFAPLSRAYDRGRLTRGRLLIVRDAAGTVYRYRLRFARVVPRSLVYRGRDGWSWALGATTRPSLTLITCRGRNSRDRLVVRFVLESAATR